MPRAVLADPNGLLGWPKVAEAARLPGRGLEPQATNLRVHNNKGYSPQGLSFSHVASRTRAEMPRLALCAHVTSGDRA